MICVMQRLAMMLALAAVLLLGGCTSQSTSDYKPTNYSNPPSPYRADYRYGPNPAMVDILSAASPQSSPALTAYVSLAGIRPGQSPPNIPASVEVRLRLDNHSNQPVYIDPESLQLETGELRPLPSPILQPTTLVVVPPGQSQQITAYFPFPPGTSFQTIDINHFRARWRVEIGQQPVSQSAQFDRIP